MMEDRIGIDWGMIDLYQGVDGGTVGGYYLIVAFLLVLLSFVPLYPLSSFFSHLTRA